MSKAKSRGPLVPSRSLLGSTKPPPGFSMLSPKSPLKPSPRLTVTPILTALPGLSATTGPPSPTHRSLRNPRVLSSSARMQSLPGALYGFYLHSSTPATLTAWKVILRASLCPRLTPRRQAGLPALLPRPYLLCSFTHPLNQVHSTVQTLPTAPEPTAGARESERRARSHSPRRNRLQPKGGRNTRKRNGGPKGG